MCLRSGLRVSVETLVFIVMVFVCVLSLHRVCASRSACLCAHLCLCPVCVLCGGVWVCMCVCVRARARACVRACVRVRVCILYHLRMLLLNVRIQTWCKRTRCIPLSITAWTEGAIKHLSIYLSIYLSSIYIYTHTCTCTPYSIGITAWTGGAEILIL